ncbi:cytochrome P450, partial [Sinorhizobium meliloti]|uniref:cytochrome P450 n=1 Tax=Rhizobium meliloti TaxID=382 RepID=UPI003F14BA91
MLTINHEEIEGFVEEVRRLYPFFPFVGARLRKDLVWQGHSLGKDDWLLLDLYGTTHDARLFPQPAVFNPKRESSWRNGTSASFHKEEVGPKPAIAA